MSATLLQANVIIRSAFTPAVSGMNTVSRANDSMWHFSISMFSTN